MGIELSKHAEQRIRQRGRRRSDIDAILSCGTPIDGASYYLLDRDVDREIGRRKREISDLERLRGWRVVMVGDEKVATVYRASRRTEKRLLRDDR